MIPQKELKEMLQSRLGDRLNPSEIENLSRDILALEEGWEEFDVPPSDMGYGVSAGCSEICLLADQIDHGAVIKMFRKKRS